RGGPGRATAEGVRRAALVRQTQSPRPVAGRLGVAGAPDALAGDAAEGGVKKRAPKHRRPPWSRAQVAELGVEYDHRAGDLAALHLVKGRVDLLDRQAAGDHVVELQLAGHVEVDEPRHVDREAVRAHQRALDAFLAEEGGA